MRYQGEEMAVGAWCSGCGMFFPDSDPDDDSECGHTSPARIVASVIAEPEIVVEP